MLLQATSRWQPYLDYKHLPLHQKPWHVPAMSNQVTALGRNIPEAVPEQLDQGLMCLELWLPVPLAFTSHSCTRPMPVLVLVLVLVPPCTLRQAVIPTSTSRAYGQPGVRLPGQVAMKGPLQGCSTHLYSNNTTTCSSCQSRCLMFYRTMEALVQFLCMCSEPTSRPKCTSSNCKWLSVRGSWSSWNSCSSSVECKR